MKKSGIFLLIAITAVFAAFVTGFYIGRNTNHAAVHIQTQPQASTLPVTPGSEAPATSCTPATIGLINVNLAPAEVLTSLPGIGPVLAQRIVDYRMTYGYFNSVNDLLKVEGIGENKLNDILDYITI